MDVYHLDRDVLEIGWWNLATAIPVVQDCKLDGVTYHSERIAAVVATRMDLGESRDDDIVAVIALGFQDHAVAHVQNGGMPLSCGGARSLVDCGARLLSA